MTDEKPMQSDPNSLIENAQKAAERLEQANRKMEDLIKSVEAMKVEAMLSGKSQQSTPIEKETADQRIEREAKEFLKSADMEWKDF